MVLMMTCPWAGFGVLFVWSWLVATVAVRWRLRGRDAESGPVLVGKATLWKLGILSTVGYVALAFLMMGSLLMPSLVVGLVWAVYLMIRLIADSYRLFYRKDRRFRTTVAMHSVWMAGVLVAIGWCQVKANTLEYQIAALRFGNHPEMYSKVMPSIVARGEEAVDPLIGAIDSAMANGDSYRRSNTVVHATFCLSRIGGAKAAEYLANLLKQHREPDDYGYRRGFKAVHFAYARCVGPQAVSGLIDAFEKSPVTKDRDDRWIPLVALLLTGSREGVMFVLDHFEVLLDQMQGACDGNEASVLQAATGAIVYGDTVDALRAIPVYRDVSLMGDTKLAEARPNDYNSEFFWIPSSESSLRKVRAIASKWESNSVLIRNRWSELLD